MNTLSSSTRCKARGYSQRLEAVAKESDPARYLESLPYFYDSLLAIIADDVFGESLLEQCISEEPQTVCDLLAAVVKYPISEFITLYRMLDENHVQSTQERLSRVGLEVPALFLKFLSQLLAFGKANIDRLYQEGILSAPQFHKDMASDIDRMTGALMSIDYFGIDHFLYLCDKLKLCGLFQCINNDLSAFSEGLPFISLHGIDEFISSFRDDELEYLKTLVVVGIASDLTIPHADTHTACDAAIVRNRLLHVKRLEYLKSVADILPRENRRERALYIASGSDFITGYMVSGGARETILVDRLPFKGTNLSPNEVERHKREYLMSKYVSHYSAETNLLPSVGAGRYLFWELEAMGVPNIREVSTKTTFDGERGAHRIRFRLPDESEERVIAYYEVDACNSSSYSQALRKHIQEGIDCYIRKAAVKIEIPKEIMEIIQYSLHPAGLMFIDDEAFKILGSIQDMFREINDARTQRVRYFEAERSMAFGYNPISIFYPIESSP